jgi:hypothetical protein
LRTRGIVTAIGKLTALLLHPETLPFTRISIRITRGPRTVSRFGHQAQPVLSFDINATCEGESKTARLRRNCEFTALGSPLLWTPGCATTIGNLPEGFLALFWCVAAPQPVATEAVNTTAKRR